MPETILRTKLYTPPLRPNLVSRPRLIRRLDQGLDHGHILTLLSAPAGFGKSTLLSAWVQGEKLRPCVAWLSLDEGDNDLTRFLTYFVAALQTIHSDIGRGVVAALQSPGEANVEALLTALLNEIADYPDDAILILDDYHLIESRPVDEALTFLLERLPPQTHLVIAGRIDPSLPLSRLRARGQMTEIRADDLRFTAGEAAAFLSQVVTLELSDQDVIALETRTEGWIAGLQLVALSMQGFEHSSEIAGFVNRFTGSNRYIQDYLTDEVLQQQSRATKEFLLQTSILRNLNGSLCDAVRFGADERSEATAVTGENSSQAFLERLEAANLFITPLDNERRWYRYHHLFADLLTYRLSRTYPDQIPVLHRRASVWHENEGYLDDAIRHAQVAGDSERLADIIEKHWQEIVHRGEANRLRQLLDSVGPAYTRKSPPLSMAYCWTYVLTGEYDLIARHLKDIKEVLAKRTEADVLQQPAREAVIPSLVATMEAAIALVDKRAGNAKEHAQRAIALIPGDIKPAIRMLLQGAAAYRLALAHRALGEYEQACAVLLEGLAMLKASENYFGAAATVMEIAAIYEEQGKTEAAASLCEEMLDYIEVHQWQKMPSSGLINLLMAGLKADAGDIAEAKKNLAIGRQLTRPIESSYTVGLVKDVEEKLENAPPPSEAPTSEAPTSEAPTSQALVEPLSPRELQVLQLIAEGLSNREISERLFLALDTVKGHNRRIYGKLGVHRRTEAIARARELGLL